MEFVLLALVIITIFGIGRIVCRELKKKTDILASGKEGEVFPAPTFIKEEISEERKKQFKGVWDAKKLLRELLNITQSVEGWQINLDEATALKLLELTDGLGGETKLAQSVSCIGVPTCQMGILNSQELLDNIISYFNHKKYKKDILPRVYISGCPNSCGVHQIGSIGFAGKKKQ